MKKFVEALTSRLITFALFAFMALIALISPEKVLKAADETFAKMREK